MAEPDEKIVQVVNHLSHVFEEKKVEVVNNLNQIFEEEKKQLLEQAQQERQQLLEQAQQERQQLLEQAAQEKQQLLVEYDQVVKNKDENEMMLKEEIEILKQKLYGQEDNEGAHQDNEGTYVYQDKWKYFVPLLIAMPIFIMMVNKNK